MMKLLRQKNLKPLPFWLLAAGVAGLRLLLAACQRVYLTPEGAGLDDMLMIRAAMSVADGGWLGGYGAFAMAKNMGFSLWLALLHTLRIPVLVGNAALWVAACAFAARALRPVLPGNVARLGLFALFAFQPVSWAAFTMRVYRDAVFPALALLVFAGAVGFGLRLREKRLRGSVAFAAGTGLGLAGVWLTREDGALVLVFAVCAFLAAGLFALLHPETRRRLAKSLLSLLPFGLLAGGILAFSALNYAHYGVFMVNDLTQGAFPRAYGAMVAVSQAGAEFAARTPVRDEALAQLLDAVPSLAPLRAELEEPGPVRNGFLNPETGEFGGSFYYALRLAADRAGLTPDAVSAQAYWAQVAAEIEQQVAAGALRSARPASSVVPRWHRSLLVPTALETAWGFGHVMLFEDCDPRPAESVGPPEKIEETAAWLRSPVQQGYVEGTAEPYYNPLQRAVFALCDVLTLAYCVAVWPLLFLALRALVRALAHTVRTLRAGGGVWAGLLPAVLLLGLLLSFLLRLAVAAYMESAAFGIGTYMMYLSGGVPALLLFCALGALLPVPARQRETPRRLALSAPSPHGGRDVRAGAALALGAGLVLLKLLLASAQQVYLNPTESGLDDMMMVNAARSITQGEWLGAYGWQTLSKQAFFALWLAVLNRLHIPFLLGGQALWALAALAGAAALAPVLKKRKWVLLLFGVLLFNPASAANPVPFGFVSRPYRDNIFPALCLACVAGMVGYALRHTRPLRRSIGWLALAGAGLAGCWLTREDGWWLLPFVVAAAGITLVFLLRAGPKKQAAARCAALLLPFAMLGAGLAGWAGMNRAHYGRFILTDFSSGEFAGAVGAMTRVEHEDWNPKVSVPRDVREKLYATVPAFAELAPLLESEHYYNRYTIQVGGGADYSSGAFYWALREAAAERGHYETPEASRAYFAALARDINALCDEGVLPAGAKRSSVSPPVRAAYIGPVLRESANSLWFCATFRQCDARSMRSVPDEEGNIAWVQEFLHEKALFAAEKGTDRPYFSPPQKLAFRALDIVRGVYALALPPLLCAALAWQVWGGVRLVRRLRKKETNSEETLLWLVQLGLLLCILLRVAMIAFVTVASFTIGTYVMYLASVHPLMLLFGFVGTFRLAGMLRPLAAARGARRGRAGGVG